MSKLLKIIIVSRYRFWSYTSGPYLLGYTLGASSLADFYSLKFFLVLLFFLLPANIFLYGVNDLYDRDTDRYNRKKGSKENKLQPSDEKFILLALIISSLTFFVLMIFTSSTSANFTLLIFWLLSFFYSAKPFRLKSKPFVDSASNVLYILPGIYGYIITAGTFPPIVPLIGFWFWSASMHLFSAIPDISADKKANLYTTAVFLKGKGSLFTCSLLWSAFFIITYYYFKHILIITLIIYPLIPITLIFSSRSLLNKVYWYFPYINTLLGFIMFALALSSKL